MSDAIVLVKELQALADDMVDPKGKTMDQWDNIRNLVETHEGSDLPRLVFEDLMESISEKIREAAEMLAVTETGYQRICEMNDGLQKLVGMQERLGPEAEKVLNDNLWNLYERSLMRPNG